MLHETTQRRICRIAFAIGCVLPTLCVVIATARVWLPGYAAQWVLPLGQILDCRASVERFDMPRPGIVRFDRVVLSDPETNTTWIVLHEVSHEIIDGRNCIAIARAEIGGEAAAEIARVERLLRSSDSSEVAVTIGSLVVVSKSQSLRLPNIRVQIARSETGSHMQLWSAESAEGLRLSISRNRQVEPPATQVVLQSGTTAIPCELLAAWDRFEQLGPDAAFQGRLELFATRESVHGRLSGYFSQLDHPTSQLAVADLRWGTDDGNLLESPTHSSPVAAVLGQFTNEAPQFPESDIGWQLAPFKQRANVAAHSERIVK